MKIAEVQLNEYEAAPYFVKLKSKYPAKATNFQEISIVDWSYVEGTVKSTVEISQNFVAFSEYMNFKSKHDELLFVYFCVFPCPYLNLPVLYKSKQQLGIMFWLN